MARFCNVKFLGFLVGFFIASNAIGQTTSYPKGTSGGRFQLVQISEFRRDQYLVDTQSGRVWQQVCGKKEGEDCLYTVFQEISVEGITPKSPTK